MRLLIDILSNRQNKSSASFRVLRLVFLSIVKGVFDIL